MGRVGPRAAASPPRCVAMMPDVALSSDSYRSPCLPMFADRKAACVRAIFDPLFARRLLTCFDDFFAFSCELL